MAHTTAHTKDHLDISGRGFVLELQHYEHGLKQGTILRSKEGYHWKVLVRVLFDHVAGKHQVFIKEHIDFMLIRFNSEKEEQESIKQTTEKEKEHIFCYLIKPMDHHEVPQDGGKLEIYSPVD
jgi:hypothetical protein